MGSDIFSKNYVINKFPADKRSTEIKSINGKYIPIAKIVPKSFFGIGKAFKNEPIGDWSALTYPRIEFPTDFLYLGHACGWINFMDTYCWVPPVRCEKTTLDKLFPFARWEGGLTDCLDVLASVQSDMRIYTKEILLPFLSCLLFSRFRSLFKAAKKGALLGNTLLYINTDNSSGQFQAEMANYLNAIDCCTNIGSSAEELSRRAVLHHDMCFLYASEKGAFDKLLSTVLQSDNSTILLDFSGERSTSLLSMNWRSSLRSSTGALYSVKKLVRAFTYYVAFQIEREMREKREQIIRKALIKWESRIEELQSEKQDIHDRMKRLRKTIKMLTKHPDSAHSPLERKIQKSSIQINKLEASITKGLDVGLLGDPSTTAYEDELQSLLEELEELSKQKLNIARSMRYHAERVLFPKPTRTHYFDKLNAKAVQRLNNTGLDSTQAHACAPLLATLFAFSEFLAQCLAELPEYEKHELVEGCIRFLRDDAAKVFRSAYGSRKRGMPETDFPLVLKRFLLENDCLNPPEGSSEMDAVCWAKEASGQIFYEYHCFHRDLECFCHIEEISIGSVHSFLRSVHAMGIIQSTSRTGTSATRFDCTRVIGGIKRKVLVINKQILMKKTEM